jgi:glycosyltransferase involved in cell wall biosynthesis
MTQSKLLLIGVNYSPEVSGNAPYTSSLASYLSRILHVTVITAEPHYPSWKYPSRRDGKPKAPTIENPRITRLRPFLPKQATGVGRVLFEISFGVLSVLRPWQKSQYHVFVSPALIATAFALAKSRVLSPTSSRSVWIQDLYSLGMSQAMHVPSWQIILMTKLEAWVANNADSVIVIHERFKRHLVDALGVEASRVHVQPNWSQFNFQPSTSMDVIRSKYRWADSTVVLHAGNIGLKQGLDNVLSASQLPLAGSEDILFVLLGDGNQRKNLQNAAEGMNQIQFIDQVSETELSSMMNAADYLLVSEAPGVESLAVPSKLTTYYKAGKPVILCSDIASISSEEILLSAAGVRVDAGQPDQLLNAILHLSSHPAEAKKMASNGPSYAERYLSEAPALKTISSIILGVGH